MLTYEEFELTDMQNSYYLSRYDKNAPVKCCHSYFEFVQEKEINIEKLSQAWARLFDRHEMLRISIANGKQKICYESKYDKITIFDMSNKQITDAYNELEQIRAYTEGRLLNIEKGQVVALSACLMPDKQTFFLFDIDMICCDIQSALYLLHDFAAINLDEKLPAIPNDWSFRDWIKNINSNKISHSEYWHKKSSCMPGGPRLPHSNKIRTSKFENWNFSIDYRQWENLILAGEKRDCNINILILTIYIKVIAKWSEEKEFLVNIPVFTQPFEETHVIGDFSNMIIIKVNSSLAEKEMIDDVKTQYYDGLEHQPYSGIDFLRKINANTKSSISAPIVYSFHIVPALVDEKIRKTLGNLSYFINQTPKVWIDFQVYSTIDSYIFAWIHQKDFLDKSFLTDSFNQFRGEILAMSKLGGSFMNNTTVSNIIQEIYMRLLKVDTLDTKQSFLQLGGQSIMAAKLQMECAKVFSVRLTFKEIYDNSSVDKLADIVISKMN